MLQYSPRIITDSLVMCLDPSQNTSFPSYDLPVKNGLVMWMDAADDSTFSYSSGTTVSQWRDKSGFNYHMVPVSAGPTRNVFLNSRKVIACTASQQIWNSSINLVTSVYTIFCVTRLTGTTNARVLSTLYTGATGTNWLLGHWAGYVNQYYAEGWVNGPYGTVANTAWNIFMGDWSGASTDLANLYTNGTAITTNSNGANAGPLGLGINISSEASTCEAAEIIVFNRTLSTKERNLIHTYLGLKWGISNTDRSIIDLSGNNNNGLLGNGTVANMPLLDYYNKGNLNFDGVNDFVAIPNTFLSANSSFSISTWVKIKVTNTSALIDSMNDSAAYDGFALWITSGGKFIFYILKNTVSSITSVQSYSTDVWYNVVVIYNQSTIAIYINGVLDVSTSYSSGFDVGSANIALGRRGINTNEPTSCNISQTCFYNKALSAAEVAQNYEAQKSKFTNTIIQQGLVLNLDAGNPYSYAGSGITVYDVSANTTNSGSLIGGTSYSTSNGGVFVFDGVDDYILTNYSQTTDNIQVTWEAWFWDNSAGIGANLNTAIISNYGPVGTTSFTLLHIYDNGYPFFAQRNGSGTESNATYSVNICDGIWHHLVGVVDGTNTLIYVDGVLRASQTKVTGTTTSGQNIVIGGNHLGRYQSCRIGSARIYNIALSAAQVLQNYNATKSRYGL